MNLPVYLKGIAIGFSIAAPVGPIGVLCIKRSLNNGHLSGFFSGMGAASADAVYGMIAGFGLTFISSFLIDQKLILQSVGMLFLFYLGIKTIMEKKEDQNTEGREESRGLLKDYLSTFFLTITNPMTILSFTAVFAGLGLGAQTGDYRSAIFLVTGVFSGSILWWILLSNGVGLFRTKIKAGFLKGINLMSGIIILGFASLIAFSLVKDTFL